MAYHSRVQTPRRHMLATVLLACLPVAGTAVLLVGCGGTATAQKPYPAPVISQAPAPEDAYWRRRYDQNRPAAPENYQVFPKPPRNNGFGEFEDGLHQGLDTQPALPPLPADTLSAQTAYLPPDRRDSAFSGPPGPYAPTQAAAGARIEPTRLAVPATQGVNTGAHFYPVEQLVYGGDYPDIDKPELYRLQPRDVISITVKDHPEFCGQLEIQPDGTVGIPNAPDIVRLRGLTVEEAANRLREVLSVYIKGETKVRVQANRARGGYYFVFGDVLQPGRFPMGMEPIKLSDAVLAANWEANPARRDLDGDELGPSFPAASPRGKYIAPDSADLARVALITPHRSQPVRTIHDVRSAMLGVAANDPVIRPGQIIVVPSLVAERNRDLGLVNPPEAKMPGRGFSGAASTPRLPEVVPPAPPPPAAETPSMSAVETNMTAAFDTNLNTSGAKPEPGRTVREGRVEYSGAATATTARRGNGWRKGL